MGPVYCLLDQVCAAEQTFQLLSKSDNSLYRTILSSPNTVYMCMCIC